MTANDIVMHDAPSTTTVMSTSSVSSQSSSNSASSQVTVNGKPKKSKTKHPKTFQCTGYGDCRMTFTRSEHLARHIRKHTGERPFRCHCNRTFSRLDNLRQHIQTVHANEHHILHAPPPPPLSASSAGSHTTVRITDQRNKSHLHQQQHHHHHHQPQQHHHMHPQHQLQQAQSHMSLAHSQHHQHQNYSIDHQKQQPLPPLPQEHFTHQHQHQQQQQQQQQQQHPQQQHPQHIIIEHHPVPSGPTFGQPLHHQQPQSQQNHAPHPSAMNGSAKHRPQPLALKSSEHAPSSAYMMDGRSSPLSPGGGPHHKFDTAYPPSSPYAYSSLPSPVPPPPPPPQVGPSGSGSGYYHQVPPLPSTPSNQDHTQDQTHQNQLQAYHSGSGASQYSTPPPNPQAAYDASMYRSAVLTPASSRHHSSNISSPASSTTTTTRTTSWLSSVLNDSGSSSGLAAVDDRPHTWGPSSKRFSSTTDDGGERNSMMSHLISITEDAHISTPKVEGGFASSPMAATSETSKLPPISALIGDQKPPLLSSNRSYTKNLILPRPESYPPPKGFPPHGFHSGSMGDNMPSPVDEHSSHGHNVQSASGPSARTTKHLSKPLPPLPADVESDDKRQEVNSGGMDMLMQAAGV